ncbi:MAG: chitobiase/beta-hexosaminidase C-terminal domain-containing protein [Nevskiales bacterium]
MKRNLCGLVIPAEAGVQKRKRWVPAFAGTTAVLLLAVACAPREALLPRLGVDVPALREFPADFPLPDSNETEQPIVGFGGGGGGVTRAPVIFVHGNTVSARFWLPVRAHFKAAGYTDDELWAPGYGWDNVRYFDSNDLSVPTLERFVSTVQNYLQRKTGKPIPQVDIVGHSLGVTLVRQWLKQENAWHRVRNFVGVAGGNHGVWTARLDSRTMNRVVSYELARGSPWLAQLNRGGETPGATRYLMLYDGTGWGDALFTRADQDSAALAGATNLAFNRERGTHFDHLELARTPATMDAMLSFLKDSGAVSAEVRAPVLRLDTDQGGDHVLRAEPAAAQVVCAKGGDYPSRATPAAAEVVLAAETVYSCYAFDPAAQLASPLQRFKWSQQPASADVLTVTASHAAGAYENPISVTLSASDPAAYVVYSTSGSLPGSGAALYTQAVYVPGPLRLSAVAIAPDGRQSPPLVLDYDISLEKIEAAHSLQRQFDASVPEQYRGQRKKGH